ncbi:MAG: hypothetical protein IPF50_02565 [Proteobacteria bacterium]|nr:hypothetical protein [Pseudomonadota bacterium]
MHHRNRVVAQARDGLAVEQNDGPGIGFAAGPMSRTPASVAIGSRDLSRICCASSLLATAGAAGDAVAGVAGTGSRFDLGSHHWWIGVGGWCRSMTA